MQFIKVRKQIKKQAHTWLKSDYGKLFLIYAPMIALFILFSMCKKHIFLAIPLMLLTMLVSFGAMTVSVHLLRGHIPNVPYLKMSFNDFKEPNALKNSIIILLRMYWLLIVAMLLKAHIFIAFILLVAWCVRMLQLNMSPYIYADALTKHNNISAEQAIRGSEQLMKGHLDQYFMLCLSLIGWTILSVLPFTIGLFGVYTIPYTQLVIAEYYIYLTQHHQVALTSNTSVKQPQSNTQSSASHIPNNVYPDINQNSAKNKKSGKGLLSAFNGMFHKFDKKPAKSSTPKPSTNNGMGLNNNQSTGLGLKGGQSVTPNINNVNYNQTQTRVQNPNPNIPHMSNKVSVNTQQQPVNNMQSSAPNMPKMAMPGMSSNQPQATAQPQQHTQPTMQNTSVGDSNPSSPVSPATAMKTNPDNPMNNSSWQQKIQQISQKYNTNTQSQPQSANTQTTPISQSAKSLSTPQGQMDELNRIAREQGNQN